MKPARAIPVSFTAAVYLLLGLALSSASAHAGVFQLSDGCKTKGKRCSASYVGEIEMSDVQEFQQILAEAARRRNDIWIITLESPGGDIHAALTLGQLVRRHSMLTLVLTECSSSCVIVLAGGVNRSAALLRHEVGEGPNAKIGIHRPYTEQLGASFEQHQAEFKLLGDQIREFLRDGGVSERLWDDMMKIPPSEVRLLTHDEAKEYGLLGVDPAFADYWDSKEAERLGISKQELLRRRQAEEVLCPPSMATAEWVQCRRDVLEGRRR